MPELPEVEVVCRSLGAFASGRKVTGFTARVQAMKWPISQVIARRIVGARVCTVRRRAKYIVLEIGSGALVIHLGMSGTLRVVGSREPLRKHDHVDISFGKRTIRLRDPRRFGGVLWLENPRKLQETFRHIGVEPLSDEFDGEYLHRATRKLRRGIKKILLDQSIVCGIGNIYASESLFRARIHPGTPGGRLGMARCERLAVAIKQTLSDAIDVGGATLRDFRDLDGEIGEFQQDAFVYGRAGLECVVCGQFIRVTRDARRSTYYCPGCQRW
jgi:formamidopyrimidine-DNA glycosylase